MAPGREAKPARLQRERARVRLPTFIRGRRRTAKTSSRAGQRARQAEFRRASFVEPQLVKWKSFDGREITGFLYLPDAAKFPGKRPVDRSASTADRKRSSVPTFAGRDNYFINELGCALLTPNVRGSAGYGKSFLKLDNGLQTRGFLQGHFRAARLDRIEPAARSGSHHGDGRLIRRFHDPAGGVELRGPHPLRARRGRHFQSRHLSEEHGELPARSAPGRIRRRARPAAGGVHGTDRGH